MHEVKHRCGNRAVRAQERSPEAACALAVGAGPRSDGASDHGGNGYDYIPPGGQQPAPGQWDAYVPGPRQPVPWMDPADARMGADALAGGAVQTFGTGLRLLTPLSDG